MRVLIQRVSRAAVRVRRDDGSLDTTGQISRGLLLLVGFRTGEDPKAMRWIADKILSLRIFQDHDDKMNLALPDIPGAAILVVSQFTLYADAAKGRRPSFIDAARPNEAIPLYESFVETLRLSGTRVETGEFGAMMDVELVNDGPVTIWLER
ncbi:MAG: D-aminoacyl-tRNA deacylase [Gemmatimonadota bacterium]